MEQLIFAACGVFGVIFHSLIRLAGIQKDAKMSNVELTFKMYLSKDAIPLLLSLLSVIIWLMIFAEVAASYPRISAFTRTSFVVMGAIGSYLIQLFFQFIGSGAKAYVNKFADVKANTADALIGTTPKTVEEAIILGTTATGHDVSTPPPVK